MRLTSVFFPFLPLFLGSGFIHAQSSVPAPRFEVAAIKPSVPFLGKAWVEGGPGSSDPARVTYHDRSLTQLVYLAYDINSHQVSLPSWMDNERFDIIAKVPVGAGKRDLQAMLRNLLEERFHLNVAHEFRRTAAYRLTLGKNGSRMTAYPTELPPDFVESTPRFRDGEDQDGFIIFPHGYATGVTSSREGVTRFSFARVPLRYLCNALAAVVLAPVVDATGLSGRFDIHLAFAQENYPPVESPPEGSLPQALEPALSVFRAVEKQLGLKLEQKTMPVEFFVVRSCDKVPVEN
jgi:uncharacterized protein (TIGR03435 family)